MAKVSQNISSDSLFHFIKRREWLFKILNEKTFKARYVYEELPDIHFHVGIPMKCFCDIPLGLIKKHLSHYGKFGIGISKNYAKQNSLSPVIYVHKKSDTMLRYLRSVKKGEIFKNNPNSLFPYFKLDETYSSSIDGKRLITRFYDEREWRWIPNDPKFEDFSNFTEEEIIKTRLSIVNDLLEKDKTKYLLPFEYKDITYIFVQQVADVDKVIDEIRRLKISQIEQDRLISKIITARQIEKDF
ncbi:abortive infection system antitoxin AbiGi family protein [Flavobacterium sp.]|uniref:abortive infection system antitoxin AbiGi family protein n=1 Tax=Flavobacterium sp. TaxID=239 RepID=UPI00391B7081